MWEAIMLAGRATRTGALMNRCGAKLAFYVTVGIVEPKLPNSNSHAARSGCNQSFLNVNAGPDSHAARDEEREKVKRYKVLCNQRRAAAAGKHLCQSSSSSRPAGAWSERLSSDRSGTLTGRGSRQRTLR
jgi:hypothetical protein